MSGFSEDLMNKSTVDALLSDRTELEGVYVTKTSVANPEFEASETKVVISTTFSSLLVLELVSGYFVSERPEGFGVSLGETIVLFILSSSV